ncbi:substrate-binding domain-containing protein [Auraticoccus sp. F435]|uniref:Substrate-binding domain-containing protein n=1 Tax=Auraticoccus cholistanensis TaxID=2656650 RepID=A0A6A9UV54_9ACTN|nr:LacI family DNA-binding transcriptional regulator [Auraticoccus cholistanensis]MVA75087.1 substrate-binding domain-containing protein [Auraticoccus cholistanensis]
MTSWPRVTARHVAARAGVSPGTVSKALSGKGAVHPDTRDRILTAARELGFRSNRGPVGHEPVRARTVGLVIREPFARRTAPVVTGAIEALAERDIALLLCDGRGDAIREQYFVESLLRRGVDGILVAGGSRGSFSRSPLQGRLDVPVVYVMAASTDPRDLSVVPDNRGGAEQAVAHLVATGRRRLACIFGPRREEAAQVKTAATVEVLAASGLELAAEPLYGHWDEQWGRQAAMQLVHSQTPFDGLVCGNDLIARGATGALHELGLSVPEDVGVIGFDNWDVMVEGNRPRLSSIDLSLPEVGRTAATRMAAEIDQFSGEGGVVTVECLLVPRESTAVPRRGTARVTPLVEATRPASRAGG